MNSVSSWIIRIVAALFVVTALTGPVGSGFSAQAQQQTEFGGVEFPQGASSFADRLVSFTAGPGVSDNCANGSLALGAPDYERVNDCTTYVSLGNSESVCQAELILEFRDNYLIDVDGDDIYVFEIGAAVEATELYIGNDGQNWIPIGRVEGSTRGVDISEFVGPGDRFTLVRLCDFVDGASSGSPFAGPDIDAVGAIGSEARPTPTPGTGGGNATATTDDSASGAATATTTSPTTGGGTAGQAGTATPVPGGAGDNPDVPGASIPPPDFPSPQPSNVGGLTIQAGQRLVVAGGFVWVPVYLLRSGNVANMNFEIEYSASVAVIEGDPVQGNLLGNHIFRANPNDRGIVRVGVAGTSGIFGSGTVAWLPFRAVGQPGDVTQLTVTVSTINTPDGTVPRIDRIHGRIIITDRNGQVPGDCNGDAILTEFDAFCALEMSVQLRPVDLVLDMNGDGQVTSRDATLILQRVLGIA